MSSKTIIFAVERGGKLEGRHEFSQNVIKVGSLPSSHLRLVDGAVSRMHAVIEISDDGAVSLIDLGSAAGTHVNGHKINKSPLDHGDEIRVGQTTLHVGLDREPPILQTAQRPVAHEELGQDIDFGDTDASGAGSGDVPTQVASAHAVQMAEPTEAYSAEQSARIALLAKRGNPFPATPPPLGPSKQRTEEVTDRTRRQTADEGEVRPASLRPDVQVSEGEQVAYHLVASGPAVTPSEVETDATHVEVMVMWGKNTVLHVSHISGAAHFVVGEPGKGKDEQVDYLLASSVLGAERFKLVSSDGTGAVAVTIPAEARAEVSHKGQAYGLEQLRQMGHIKPSPEGAGASEYYLPPEASISIEKQNFTFVVRPVAAGKPIVGGMPFDGSLLNYIAASALFFFGLLGMFYFLPPSSDALSIDQLDEDAELIQYLLESAEEKKPPKPIVKGPSAAKEGGSGERHKGDEGKMGDKKAPKANKRYAVKGPKDNKDPHMARAVSAARNAGALGVLAQFMGSLNAPTSPFGRDTALGRDYTNALGNLYGSSIGAAAGIGGLGLSGAGSGGGGDGEGTVGMGKMGTMGHGSGGGRGQGYGKKAGGLGGRGSKVPTIRSGPVKSVGGLSKETIRRVVQRHRAEVRGCYEAQLTQQPDMQGRVTIGFVIAPTGRVQSSVVAGSTVKNRRVEQCIASAVKRWSFPAPDGGGVVSVNYPFLLAPTGG